MSGYAAIILAAGQGSRFLAAGGEGATKLVARFAGEPLVRHVARSALAARTDSVIVVTGHAQAAVAAALAGLGVREVYNSAFATGLASTLKAGIAAVPPAANGAVVLLGDMPQIDALAIDRLVTAAQASPQADAIVPVQAGRRGNPVLLSRRLFDAVNQLEGDAGARQLLRDVTLDVVELPFEGRAVAQDIDTPADLAALQQIRDGG